MAAPAIDSSATSSAASTNLLDSFRLVRILDQDPKQKSANLLGTLQGESDPTPQDAILLLEKTHFSPAFFEGIGSDGKDSSNGSAQPPSKAPRLDAHHDSSLVSRHSLLGSVQNLGQNDIYTWLLAWLSSPSSSTARDADVKLTLIHPATSTHIDKYSAQSKSMVYETPAMYRDLVRPYLDSIPASRIQWVYNILEHQKEADTILYEDPHLEDGFIVVPDLKWDQKTLSSLYLQAIVHDRRLRSLRDLKQGHVKLLKEVRDRAHEVAAQRFGLEAREDRGRPLRCFIHYQPSYYHLHIHILSSSFTSHPGSIVGQAHLLDDVIDLLELGVDFEQRTLGYALGEKSKLWEVLRPALGGEGPGKAG